MGSRRRSQAAVLGVLLLATPPVDAQPRGDTSEVAASQREQARGYMDLGRRRLAEKRYDDALEAFEAADAIMKVPVTALAVAETLVAKGQLILARDRMLTIARSKPVTNHGVEPTPFTRARERAGTLARELAVRIPSVRVEVLDEDGNDITSEATVKIAGRAIDDAQRGLPQRIDPGEVEVTALVDDRVILPRTVDVEESEHHVVSLIAVPPGGPGGGSVHPFVWAGVATVAVGGVFGGVFGGAALSKSASLDGRCANGLCPGPEAQGEIDNMNLFATLSTVGFAVAAAGAALGAVGVVFTLQHDTPSEAALVVGPAGGALRVQF